MAKPGDRLDDSLPLVSVGMPVHNGATFLTDAIEALVGQTYPTLEILVSDNASTDDTRRIAEYYASRHENIHYFRHPENVGASENFSAVLEQASGDYFMWAAHDDLWDSLFVEAMVEQLEADPGAVLAFCNLDNIDAQARSIRSYPTICEIFEPGTVRERLERLIWFEEAHGKANLVYGLHRADALRACGGLRGYGHGDWGIDYLLVYRMALLGHFAFDTRTLFHKRLMPTPLERDPERLSREELLRGYFANMERVFQEAALSDDDRSYLLDSVRRREARGII